MAIKFDITGDNKQLLEAVRQVQEAVNNLARSLGQIVPDSSVKAGRIGTNAATETKKAVDKADDSVKELNQDVNKSTESFGKLTKAAGAFFSLQAAKGFASKIFEVRSEVESLQTSFRILVGDKDKADKLFQDIKEFAVSTPMQMKDLASAAQTMMGFGLPLEQIMENLKAIGDVSMGDAQKFQSLALSFSQMSAAGKLMGGDLMQMINAGFNPLAVISEKTGKSIGKLKEEMEKGAISANMVRQAFIDATSEGGKYAGMLEAQSQTLQGAYSNLQGAIDDMLNDIGEKTQGVFTSAIDAATFLAKNYETVGKVMLTVAAAFGTYKAALMVTVALQKSMAIASSVSAFISLAKSVTSAKDAMALFNLVTKANPIGLILSAVAAAAAAFSLFGKKESDAEKATRRYSESVDKATNKVRALYSTLSTANKASKVSTDTAKELKNVADEYGLTLSEEAKKIGNETKLVEELTAKREELIDTIRREAIERERANQMEEVGDVYAKSIEEARKELKESLGVDDILASAMANSITDEQIQKLAELKRTMEEVRLKEGEMSQAAVHASEEYMSAYQKVLFQLQSQAMEYAELSGKTEEYEGKLLNIREALNEFVNSTNESNTQLQNSKIAISNATLAQTEAINVMDAANISASNLNTITQALIDKWNAGYSLDLQINVDTSNVPAWITNMTDEELKKGIAERQNELRNSNFLSRWFGTARSDLYTLGVMQSEANKREAKKPTVRPTALKPTPKKTGKTGSKGKVWNEEHARQDREKIQKEYTESIKDMLEDIAQEISDAEIEYEDESTQKGLKKLDEDEKKRLKAIKERRENLIEDRRKLALELHTHTKGGDKYNFKDLGDDEYLRLLEKEQPELLAALKKQEEQITKAISKERAKIIKEESDAQAEALRDYLKAYGTYEQKRLAITQETEKKIADAKTTGEKMMAIAQGNDAIKVLEKEQQQRTEAVNWEGIFGNLSLYGAQELENFKEQLRKKLSETGLEMDEYKTIVEQISNINDAIIDANEREKSFWARAVSVGRERKKIELEIADAVERQKDAQEKLARANTKVLKAEIGISDLGNRYFGPDGASLSKEQLLERVKASYGENSKQYEAVVRAIVALDDAIREQTQATDENTTAQENVSIAEKKKEQNKKQKTTEQEILDKVLTNISSLPDLAASLGFDENTAIGKGAAGIADMANSAMGAYSDFMNGNFIGAASKAFDALGSLGEVMGVLGIGGFGMSDQTLLSDIEKLTATNNALIKAVEELSKDMRDASPAEAMDIYRKQVDMLNLNAENTREIMRRSGAVYNSGFVGIGGKGSTNKKINKGMTVDEWSQISAIVGGSVTGASDFWALSQEQMHDVAKYAPVLWAKLKSLADDGLQDVAQYMDAYADGWEAIKEATDQLHEKLTSTTFDSVYDSFASMLSDMDSDAHTFSENFEKYMFDALLNQELDKGFREKLKRWYEDFATMAEDGLTQSEIANLRGRYMNLSNEGRRIRDELSAITGYGASGEGSATYNAAKSFSQEQGDILNGRLTAIQINTAEGNLLRQQIVNTLTTMNALVAVNGSAVNDMRDLMALSNTYLEDMVRYAKATYNDFGEKIDKIVLNTQNL